jgi:hypothetical protein
MTSNGSVRRRLRFVASVSAAKSNGRLSSAVDAHHVVDCCGTTSTTRTREFSAAIAARFIVVVVFPAPPFWLVTATSFMASVLSRFG